MRNKNCEKPLSFNKIIRNEYYTNHELKGKVYKGLLSQYINFAYRFFVYMTIAKYIEGNMKKIKMFIGERNIIKG